MPNPEPNPPVPPQVQDKRVRPSGVMPKNTQALVLCGLAAVMVIVIALSGKNAPKEKTAPAPATAVETDAARIQEYEARLKEEAEKLETAKTQLAHTQQAFGVPSGASAGMMIEPRAPAPEPHPEESSLQTDRKKRDEQSLFASNVALSYRKEAVPPAPPVPASPADVLAKALSAYSPAATLSLTKEVAASDARLVPEPPLAADKAAGEAGSAKARAAQRDAALDRAEGQEYRLFEGTVLETVLTNRLDGTFSGPINCMVTTDVYSRNGQRLLIPQGSRVLGDVRKVETFGDTRLAVVFHRLLMPDGYSVSLDGFHGLNQIGETGLQDQVNHHYLEVFGVSIALGLVAGFSQANTSYGAAESATDAYRQGMASSLSQSSMHILDRYLNVLPTITIREGHRVKVYLSDDLLLPAYEKHRMPNDV
jgi:type IV secretory pathway VirB10-like protein